MLFEPLFANAAKQPQEIAIVDDSGTYTYQQLAAMSAGLGMYLSMQTRNEKVGLLLPAGAGFVASFYGTLLAGKSIVPINFLLGDKEIAHVIADSAIDTVVTIPFLAGRLKDARLNIIDLKALPQTPPMAITPNFPSPKSDDLAVLMYTSGTSGLPKGVMLSYGNLQGDVDAAIEHGGFQHKHVFLGVIPLFHAFGLTGMMLAPIQLGAKIVYLARFSAVAAHKAIKEHQVSLMFGVPSMYGAIAHLKSAVPDDFKSVYAAISGAEPLPAPLREKFFEKFGVHIFEGYGLTETSPVVTLNVPNEFRPGSVGKAVPGAQVKITDENNNALAQGDTGEIWLKGPMVMKGYHNLPTETAAALTADGFFKTGDLGHIDPDGFLFITGRKKEMISVAGEKASPREIEDILLRHPSVQDAAVLGKKDESRGEVVVAFVQPKDGQKVEVDVLRNHCRDSGLAQWKIPREIFPIDDLPRSPTGKVLKRVLAERLVQGAP